MNEIEIKKFAESHNCDERIAKSLLMIAIDTKEAHDLWLDPTPQIIATVWSYSTHSGEIKEELAWDSDLSLSELMAFQMRQEEHNP